MFVYLSLSHTVASGLFQSVSGYAASISQNVKKQVTDTVRLLNIVT